MGAKASLPSVLNHVDKCACADCQLQGFEDPIDGLLMDLIPFQPEQCSDPALQKLFIDFSSEDSDIPSLLRYICERLVEMKEAEGGARLTSTDRTCWFLTIKIALVLSKCITQQQRQTLATATTTLCMPTASAHEASLDFSANQLVLQRSKWPTLLGDFNVIGSQQVSQEETESMAYLLLNGANHVGLPLFKRALNCFQCCLPSLLPVIDHEVAFLRSCQIASHGPTCSHLLESIERRLSQEETVALVMFIGLGDLSEVFERSVFTCILSKFFSLASTEELATLPLMETMSREGLTTDVTNIVRRLPVDRFLLLSKVLWPKYRQHREGQANGDQLSAKHLDKVLMMMLDALVNFLTPTAGSRSKERLRLLEQLILWIPNGTNSRDVAYKWALECPNPALAYTMLKHLVHIDDFCVPPKGPTDKKKPKPRFILEISNVDLPSPNMAILMYLVGLRNSCFAEKRVENYRKAAARLLQQNPQLATHNVCSISHLLDDEESIRKVIISDVLVPCRVQGSNLEHYESNLPTDLSGILLLGAREQTTPRKRQAAGPVPSRPSKRSRLHQDCPSTSQQAAAVPPLDLDIDLPENCPPTRTKPAQKRKSNEEDSEAAVPEKRASISKRCTRSERKAQMVAGRRRLVVVKEGVVQVQPQVAEVEPPMEPVAPPPTEQSKAPEAEEVRRSPRLVPVVVLRDFMKEGIVEVQPQVAQVEPPMEIEPVALPPSEAPEVEDFRWLHQLVPVVVLRDFMKEGMVEIQPQIVEPVATPSSEAPEDVIEVRRSARLAGKVTKKAKASKRAKAAPKRREPSSRGSKQPEKLKPKPTRRPRAAPREAPPAAPVLNLPPLPEKNRSGRPVRMAAHRATNFLHFINQRGVQVDVADFLPGTFFRNRP